MSHLSFKNNIDLGQKYEKKIEFCYRRYRLYVPGWICLQRQ